MDHDQRNYASNAADTALAANIVKAIPELERDFRLAEGPLSDRLIADIKVTMEKAAPEPWEVAETDWSALMRLPTWKPTRGLGHGDMWLLLNEISEDSTDRTWIGVSVGSGGRTQLGLEMTWRNALKPVAAAMVQQKDFADRLQKAGFRKDESGTRLFMPIAIDRLRLAKGYGENDLTEALGPVVKAVEAVVAANHDLEALVEAVRNKARGK